MPVVKNVSRLEIAVDEIKRKAVAEAIASGAGSCSEVAKHLGIDRSNAWRLLKKYGYSRETRWKSESKKKSGSRS